MLNNYIYLMYLFKLNKMGHLFLIYNSQTLFDSEKLVFIMEKDSGPALKTSDTEIMQYQNSTLF